jgi:hypothetical protein
MADSGLNCKKGTGSGEWYGACWGAEITGLSIKEYTVLHMMLVSRKLKDEKCTELDEI